MMRDAFTALQFLTIFRPAPRFAPSEENLRRAVGFYPAAGLVIGVLMALAAWGLNHLFAPQLTGLLLMGLNILFTNGLHLDGLADTADALFSHRDRATKLAIMKDSHIGVFGAVALIVFLSLKAALLAQLSHDYAALICFPALARLGVAILACRSTYAREEGGLGALVIGRAGGRELMLALTCSLVLVLVLSPTAGLAALTACTLYALATAWFMARELGGVTGDTLGALAESGEVLALLVWLGVASW